MTEYEVRGGSGLPHNFTQFRHIAKKPTSGVGLCAGRRNLEMDLLFRYSASSEEIQKSRLERRVQKALIPIEERLGEKQRKKGSQDKERTKRNIVITLDNL